MNKPKVVCIIGSAIAAPLAMFSACFIGALIAISIIPSPIPIHEPLWIKIASNILGLICVPLTIRNLYRWFFGKCYKPQAGAVQGDGVRP